MKEIIDYLIEDRLNDVHTSIPAIIESIDYNRGICVAKVDVKRYIDDKVIDYPVLIEVKLDNKTFGGWILQFPRKKGDKVWIGFSEVAENDISQERFSLNEPYLIGSREEQYENNQEDIILKGKGTEIYIKGNGEIEITTGANMMTINSNITINGDINHTGNYNVNGDIKHTGETTHTGNVNVSGAITSTGNITGSGISLSEHTHKYSPGNNPPANTGGAE